MIDQIPKQIQSLIRQACRKGYEAACENAAKNESHNSTFGTDVYHFIAYHLVEFAAQTAELELVSKWPKLRFSCNGIILACHKVGKTKIQSIHASFPNNKNAGRSIVQQRIPGLTEAAKTAIITHFGNQDDGFISAYLCSG